MFYSHKVTILTNTSQIQSVDFPGSKVELAKKVILHWIEHEHRPQAAMLAYFRYDLTAGETVPKVSHSTAGMDHSQRLPRCSSKSHVVLP